MANSYLSLAVRLEQQIRKGTSGECWEWQGARRNGYGLINDNGKKRSAHTIVWERERGKIPDGLELDHLCRNRGCVNPAHLEPVTRAENTRRGVPFRIYPNAEKTHCKHGHEFSPENTTHHGGHRQCRKCVLANVKRYQARKRSQS